MTNEEREELTAMERRARMFEAANEKMLADNKRLREENARLREALKPFAAMMDGEHMQAFAEALDSDWTRCVVTIGDLRAALAALKGEKNG